MLIIGITTCVLVASLLVPSSCSEKQLPFSGSGRFQFPVYQEINCDLYFDHKCNHSLSLEQIANNSENSHRSLYINITTGHLSLISSITFLGYKSLTITGNTSHTAAVVMTCQGGQSAGLTFSNITRLTLQGLTITNCGVISVNTVERLNFSSAITILYSKHVTLEDVIVINNRGIGLTILNHQGGLVDIKSSNFVGNKIHDGDNLINSSLFAGGGVYVTFFIPHPSEHITFKFNECIFERNIAHRMYYPAYLYTDDLGHPISGRGLGGGFGLFLERGLTNINVTFLNCSFRRNEAFLGGSLGMTMSLPQESKIENISVIVINSLFEENGCNSTASGGGMHINLGSLSSSEFDSSQLVIHEVKFINNCALFGGGLYLYSDYKTCTKQAKSTIIIERCLFELNKAHTGSAVDITPNVFQRLSSGILSTPTFKDCMLLRNTVMANNQYAQRTYGVGTIYVNLYNIKFEGYNNFESNVGTAIHIVNGVIDMSLSSGNFFNNSGIQGGAIALIGESSLIVGPNRNYTFISNIAMGRGGAIYVQMIDNHAITASKICFIQYYDHNVKYIPASDWSSTIVFNGNRALSETGHAIFSTSVYSCQSAIDTGRSIFNDVRFKSVNASEVFEERGIDIVEDTKLMGTQIATEGAILRYEKTYELQVIPGELFAHGVSIEDDFSNQAKVILAASICNTSKVKLDATFTSCVGKKLILRGKPGEKADLFLHTITSRLSYIRLKVELIDCPPGFVYSEIFLGCVCISHEYTGLLTCNTTLFYSYISPGFWAGMLNDTNNKGVSELVTSLCPLHFCSYNDTNIISELAIPLPRSHSLLPEAMCGSSRTGVACGSCAPDYTTYFHSPKYICQRVDTTMCKVGWIFYIFSELVPVTVVFIAILTLNINFTSGAINGFILFSQLLISLHIDASGIVTLPPRLFPLVEGYRLIYGLLNLEFFQIESLSFCLWHNASALDMLAFKYITVVYALLLVMTVIWFINKCGGRCLGKWCRITTVKSSVVHGISAFLILCYSQCIRISLNLLNAYPLFLRDGSNLTVSRRVWLNGDVQYFSREHLAYALPALFCLLVIGVVPPLLLLVYPLSNKVLTFLHLEESTAVNFVCLKLRITSLKPLLDSFQGSFKDNMRFFAGLYFHYRWIALILSTIPSDFDKIYTAVEIFMVTILVVHALCQPYTARIHNIIDILLFGDLALINIISFARYHTVRTRAGKQAVVDHVLNLAVLQLVLIYLPLLVMVVYIIMLIFMLCCRKIGIKGNVADWRKSIVFLGRSYNYDEEELPYRLIAKDMDYSGLEETECAMHNVDRDNSY